MCMRRRARDPEAARTNRSAQDANPNPARFDPNAFGYITVWFPLQSVRRYVEAPLGDNLAPIRCLSAFSGVSFYNHVKYHKNK
eukprot:COSAG02_NODE_3110_length_7343_cov_14.255936_7_plen_83_part_00